MSADLHGVRVCHFGHYDPSYSRNRIIAKALSRAGAEVVDANVSAGFVKRTPELVARGLLSSCDAFLVGFPGHADVPIAKLAGLVRGRPVVFDAFLSLFDMSTSDRKLVPAGSSRARWRFWEDRLACSLADLILLDTDSHITYFVDTYGIRRDRFRRIWVGSDDEVMYPRAQREPEHPFTVFFYGSFIPLHGVEHIIGAAHELEVRGETVRFLVVGSGQTYGRTRALADRLEVSSVHFQPRVSYAELPDLMSASDICLGIFGSTPRAQRVVPNKVFDALAVRRPVITADTPAARECLTHGRDAWLCAPADPVALGEAILTLKSDRELRSSLAGAGHQLFNERFCVDAISRDLATVVAEVLDVGG